MPRYWDDETHRYLEVEVLWDGTMDREGVAALGAGTVWRQREGPSHGSYQAGAVVSYQEASSVSARTTRRYVSRGPKRPAPIACGCGRPLEPGAMRCRACRGAGRNVRRQGPEAA